MLCHLWRSNLHVRISLGGVFRPSKGLAIFQLARDLLCVLICFGLVLAAVSLIISLYDGIIAKLFVSERKARLSKLNLTAKVI